MKLQCSTATLREAVQLLYPVCPLRTTLPILSNLLVKAEGGLLQLTGTDLDVSIRTCIQAEIDEEGETTIPVRFLLDALRRLSTDSIALSTDANNVSTLRAGDQVECSLRGMAPGDFPNFPQIEAGSSMELPAKDLGAMLRYTSYAVSRDETRYVLNGVCFTFGERFEVVATDGRRLTKYANPAVSQEEVTQLIVPTKSVNIITQMLSDDNTVELRCAANQLEVNVGQTSLVTRLIDGHYPNYNQVIPKTCQHAIELDRKAFLAGINLATVVTEKTKQPVVRVGLQSKRMSISAATAEIGEVNETVEVTYSGEPIDIAFNPTFLTDVCQNVDEDQIVLEVTNATSPVVVRAGEHFLCVIMPMRI